MKKLYKNNGHMYNYDSSAQHLDPLQPETPGGYGTCQERMIKRYALLHMYTYTQPLAGTSLSFTHVDHPLTDTC